MQKNEPARDTVNPASPGDSSPHKVFIVEDHPVFSEGLTQLIGRETDLVVCGQAGEFESALRGISTAKPDLVLIDITLPGKSGLDLIKRLRSMKPRPKMLAVSMHDEALYANRVLRLGGDGYIMKQEDPREIVHAMRDVLAGRLYVSEAVMAKREKAETAPRPAAVEKPIDLLTDLQLEILELLGQGESNEEIAKRLRLKTAEVESGCLEMRKRLQLSSNNALVRYAVCWVEAAKS